MHTAKPMIFLQNNMQQTGKKRKSYNQLEIRTIVNKWEHRQEQHALIHSELKPGAVSLPLNTRSHHQSSIVCRNMLEHEKHCSTVFLSMFRSHGPRSQCYFQRAGLAYRACAQGWLDNVYACDPMLCQDPGRALVGMEQSGARHLNYTIVDVYSVDWPLYLINMPNECYEWLKI